MSDETMGVLEQRRIEAGIIKPIYEEMKAELGVEVAQRILGNAIKRAAIEAGREFAAQEPGGPSLAGFAALQPRWLKGDALQIRMITPVGPPEGTPLPVRPDSADASLPSGGVFDDAHGLPPMPPDSSAMPHSPPLSGESQTSPPALRGAKLNVGQVLEYDITRCRYAEMYREMGLGEIGHLLSCNRDASFIEGYDPRIKLTRTQTIMQGASHCDFRYRVEE